MGQGLSGGANASYGGSYTPKSGPTQRRAAFKAALAMLPREYQVVMSELLDSVVFKDEIPADLTAPISGAYVQLQQVAPGFQQSGNTNVNGTMKAGAFTGPLTGNVTGNVTGDLTGDVTGDVTGNCSGSSGSCTGNAATATTATNATNVAVTDDTASADTHYPAMMSATTGNDGVEVSSSKLTFKPSTGELTSTLLVSYYLTSPYQLGVIASDHTVKGGSISVSAGDGLSGGDGGDIDITPGSGDGVGGPGVINLNGSVYGDEFVGPLTGTAASATLVALTDDTSTNATHYPTFVSETSGNDGVEIATTKLTFNPSTGLMKIPNIEFGDTAGELRFGGASPSSTNDVYLKWDSNGVLKFYNGVSAYRDAKLRMLLLASDAAARIKFGLSADTWIERTGANALKLYDGSSTVGTLTANVTGALTGNASTATSATSATDATNAANTGITDDTTTNATMYPTWVTANTGNLPQKVTSSKLTFNPSTGALRATSLSVANVTCSAPTNVLCLLSSTQVNVNTLGAVTIYTVPTGKSCVVEQIILRSASASFNQATDPAFAIGWNSPSYNNVVAQATYTTPTGTGTLIRPTMLAEQTIGTSAQDLKFYVIQASTSSTTCYVDVIGYLF